MSELLHRLTPLSEAVVEKIVSQAEGNVRAALAQAEVELTLLASTGHILTCKN